MTTPKRRPVGGLAKKYRPWMERSFLVEHYINKSQTAQTIADFTGCSQNTILNWLHKYNLPVRPQGWEGHVE